MDSEEDHEDPSELSLESSSELSDMSEEHPPDPRRGLRSSPDKGRTYPSLYGSKMAAFAPDEDWLAPAVRKMPRGAYGRRSCFSDAQKGPLLLLSSVSPHYLLSSIVRIAQLLFPCLLRFLFFP